MSMGKTRSKQKTARDGAFGSDPSQPFGSTVINVQVTEVVLLIHIDVLLKFLGTQNSYMEMQRLLVKESIKSC